MNRRPVVLLLLFVGVLGLLNLGLYLLQVQQLADRCGVSMREVLAIDEPDFWAVLGSRLASYWHLGRYVRHTGLGLWLVGGAGVAAGILALRRREPLAALLPPLVAVAWIPSVLLWNWGRNCSVGSHAEIVAVEVAEAVAPIGLAMILAGLVAVVARHAPGKSQNQEPPIAPRGR